MFTLLGYMYTQIQSFQFIIKKSTIRNIGKHYLWNKVKTNISYPLCNNLYELNVYLHKNVCNLNMHDVLEGAVWVFSNNR